jgi:hypothetical protein
MRSEVPTGAIRWLELSDRLQNNAQLLKVNKI